MFIPLVLALIGLLSNQQMAFARSVTAEGPTQAFAEAQLRRLLPDGVDEIEIRCKNIDVGLSTRWRCSARWSS